MGRDSTHRWGSIPAELARGFEKRTEPSENEQAPDDRIIRSAFDIPVYLAMKAQSYRTILS